MSSVTPAPQASAQPATGQTGKTDSYAPPATTPTTLGPAAAGAAPPPAPAATTRAHRGIQA